MTTAILYTTVEAIRASIGVDDDDVVDLMIQDQGLKIRFTSDLDSWYPGGAYVTDWEDSGFDPTEDTGVDIETPSAAERKGHLLSTYSMWFGAASLLQTMLAVPQKISDGKNEMQRFSGIDLEKIYERVLGNKAALKEVILQEATST
jgi:hypothetical protein